MIEQLFGSKTRVKLLQLFYSNPNRSFYVREITRKIDEQINSVRRELANLLSIGIISSDDSGNRLYYEVDQKYEFYEPLLQIFGSGEIAQKAEHVPTTDSTQKRWSGAGNIDLLVYTGSFTRDDSAGVDLLVVGDVNASKLQKIIAELEAEEGRELAFSSMPKSEYDYRYQVKDRFLTNVLAAKKQVIIDKQGDLTKTEKE